MLITNTERMRLEEIFLAGAMQVTEKNEYWIHGHDEGLSFCFPCAKEKVAELRKSDPDGEYDIDGGWGTENDYTPHCETCCQRLSNTLTQSGCENEVNHFLLWGFNPNNPYDCDDMHKVIESGSWEPYFEKDKLYFDDLYRLCRIILDEHFWIMPDNDYRHMWE